MQFKKYILLTIALLLVIVLAVKATKWVQGPDTIAEPLPSEKIAVATSFYPLAYLAQEIGGSQAQVTNITPAGVEPHDFEPSPRDISNIYKANLFIFNGGDIDTWAEKIQPDLETQGTKTINMISEVKYQLPTLDSSDPHLWLDPTIMSKEADIIADALITIDPSHAQEYNTSKDKLQNELAALDTAYQTGLENCQIREIITAHDAFGYLAKRYNFTVLSILGLSPEEEPSARKIAEIAELAKRKGIKHIFFEAMVSPKLSETVANEIGAQTLVLDPVEGLSEEGLKNNQNYITIMKRNLASLQTAMVCQPNQ